MHFKTHHGACSRALFELSFSKTHVWRVVANTNPHQVAQGFIWRLKKQKRAAVTAKLEPLERNPWAQSWKGPQS